MFRCDGSGDTYVVTDFLSRTSSAFKRRVGNATAVSFPAGTGAKGNAGVTPTILSTPGSIGYVAASYAITHPIQVAGLQNAAGNVEYPNLSNISAAARSVSRCPANNELHIVNPARPTPHAYPMSTFTYAIVPTGSSVGSSIAAFVKYAVSSAGQKFGPALDFAPLPAVVHKADLKAASGSTSRTRLTDRRAARPRAGRLFVVPGGPCAVLSGSRRRARAGFATPCWPVARTRPAAAAGS